MRRCALSWIYLYLRASNALLKPLMTVLHNRNWRKVVKRAGCREIAYDPQFDEVAGGLGV